MLIGAAIGVAVLATVFLCTTALIGWNVYPLSTQRIDLRGRELTSTRGIARLTNLTEALLSGNGFTDVSSLKSLVHCDYIDLTDNPVSAESYAQLKNALPACLILCEAEDNVTTEMTLGGHVLPDMDSLISVFESHKALRLVDLRGANLSEEDVALLRQRFPHISFLYSGNESVGALTLKVSSVEEAVSALSSYAGSERVTLTGCAFTPEEYRTLKAQFPTTALDCMISLYGEILLPSATEIDLSQCAADTSMEENLRLFPDLQKLTLPETLPSEAKRLKETFGLSEVIYTYNGCLISSETTEIDLRYAQNLTASDLDALATALPQNAVVRMNTPDESMLSVVLSHKGRLFFIYETSAFGQVFSTEDEMIDLGDDVTDDNVEDLMTLLDQMPYLKEAHMYESTLSQENMDLLFDSYPDIFFGWTFKMCKRKYVIRSDITAFSTLLGAPMHEYTQENFAPLRYCKNLQALDLGHNAITDLSFLQNFPHLKFLILADNQLSDISPLASLTELEYLEIFMNEDITDYSPLSNLPLKHLNIRCPGADDYQLKADPFLGISTLKRFWASCDNFSKTETERMREALPDCDVCVTDDHSTGDDWRRDDLYAIVKRMFKTREYEPYP